jgi:hypothetical protein
MDAIDNTHPDGALPVISSADSGALAAAINEAIPPVGRPLPDKPHLIAESAIYLATDGFAWVKVAESPIVPPQWARWTWAVVKNHVYFYQQGLGAIIEILDGDNPKLLLLQHYNPTSIIGTRLQAQVVIEMGIDTYACDIAKESITVGDLGTYNIYNPTKTHIAAIVPELWQQQLGRFNALGVKMEAL